MAITAFIDGQKRRVFSKRPYTFVNEQKRYLKKGYTFINGEKRIIFDYWSIINSKLFTDTSQIFTETLPAGTYQVICRGAGGAGGSNTSNSGGAGGKGELTTDTFTLSNTTDVSIYVGRGGLIGDNGGSGGAGYNGSEYGASGGGGGHPSYLSRLQKITRTEVYYEMFTGGRYWAPDDAVFPVCVSQLQPKNGDILTATGAFGFDPLTEIYGTVIAYEGTKIAVIKTDGSVLSLNEVTDVPVAQQRPYARYYVKDTTLTQGMTVYDSNFQPVDVLYITQYQFVTTPILAYSVGPLTNPTLPTESTNLLSVPLNGIAIEKPADEELTVIASANGGGGGGGAGGNGIGSKYAAGAGGGGGGGYYHIVNNEIVSVPGKNGANGGSVGGGGNSGTAGNQEFASITSGSGGSGYRGGGGSGATGGGASGGSGGGGKGGDDSGWKRRGGGGGGGAGGSPDAGGGQGGLSINDARAGYGSNYHTTPTDILSENQSYGVNANHGMGGSSRTNGTSGFVLIKRVA